MTTAINSANVSASQVHAIARAARNASRGLATSTTATRNDALERIARALDQSAHDILAENAADVRVARAALARGELSASLLDRLVLDDEKLRGMIASVRAVAALPDPIGATLDATQLDDTLVLTKVAVPLGVVAAIFEARPDAVTQIASLALKSGNAVVLKGGREATRSTNVLVRCMRDALSRTPGISPDAIGMVEERAAVDVLLGLDDEIDLIIPRGSKALVRSVQSRTRIPVMGHADGICHVYVHASADVRMAVEIVADSKVQYPAACNAAETVLIDAEVAPRLLAPLVERLAQDHVEMRVCERTMTLARTLGLPQRLVSATDDDWDTEYGALTLSCKMVDDLDDALDHIARHGSRHTEAIVASDPTIASRFLAAVDAAGVFHNASTRFADGYRYGLGAEVGVSTGKLHARGPVGLQGLTTYKYLIRGDGHLVSAYSGPNARAFLHRPLPT